MLRFSVLASSSQGNATVVSTGRVSVLVDAGISCLRLRNSLQDCGIPAPQISGVFITHEHVDHIAGLGQFCKKYAPRVYCSRYLSLDLRAAAPDAAYTFLEPGATVELEDLRVTPFSVSHDAADPLGYLFESGGAKLGYVTDTGRIMRGMDELLAGVDALYLESNYDEEMLQNSGRPKRLIERITCPSGHLSNVQACDFVRTVAHPGLRHLVLAHISPECNTPEIAHAAMQATLDEIGLPTTLYCAPRANRLPWIEL